MKKGDVVFIKYLNCLTEVLETRPDAIEVVVVMLDIEFKVWIKKSKYVKIGEI